MSKEQVLTPLFKTVVGTKVDIVIVAGLYKGHYPSRVEDFNEENEYVALAHPLMRGALLPIYRDMGFTLVIEDSSAVCEYQMSVVRLDLKTGLALLWARVEGGPNRIQRRRFLRVNCFWKAHLFFLEQEIKQPMSGRWYDVNVMDVSLGGFRFKGAIDMPVEKGHRFLLNFSLGKRILFLEGRASRVQTLDEQMWDVGVEFDSLPVSVEKALFEYIRQQEMLGRG